jgi:hypothetical protein
MLLLLLLLLLLLSLMMDDDECWLQVAPGGTNFQVRDATEGRHAVWLAMNCMYIGMLLLLLQVAPGGTNFQFRDPTEGRHAVWLAMTSADNPQPLPKCVSAACRKVQ